MPPQGRIGDKSDVPICTHGCPSCPHACIGPGVEGSPNVKVNGKPALRFDDPGVHGGCCMRNDWKSISGSGTVYINGKPAYRVGDQSQHCGGLGKLSEGSSNVMTGGPEQLMHSIQKLNQMNQALSNVLDTMNELATSSIRNIKP